MTLTYDSGNPVAMRTVVDYPQRNVTVLEGGAITNVDESGGQVSLKWK
jgi:hypothetical protein